MQRRRRDDHINWPAQFDIKGVLTPDLRPVAESLSRQRHHVLGRVHCEHPTARNQRQQQLSDAACAAPDIQNRAVVGDTVEPPEYV